LAADNTATDNKVTDTKVTDNKVIDNETSEAKDGLLIRHLFPARPPAGGRRSKQPTISLTTGGLIGTLARDKHAVGHRQWQEGRWQEGRSARSALYARDAVRPAGDAPAKIGRILDIFQL
jgi:hypothetical protein|tara:strand:- start:4462 stop:4821 length:360 start_codon:yes stop_codon:yes gene_type:complete